jgi:hypothetical protein
MNCEQARQMALTLSPNEFKKWLEEHVKTCEECKVIRKGIRLSLRRRP